MIDWLEQNAADQYKEEPGLLKFFTDKTVSWENTLHCLQVPIFFKKNYFLKYLQLILPFPGFSYWGNIVISKLFHMNLFC